MIYLDNAATTLKKPPQVAEAVCRAMGTLGNAARGAHGSSVGAARTIFDAREKIAKLFGCRDPSRVIFTNNATESLNIAIFGAFSPGDHVITTDLEHNSVLRPLYALEEERGLELSFVPADRQGRLDYDAFERLLRPNSRAVVCTHGSNLTGNLVDLRRVGAFVKSHGLLWIVDASQTAGSRPIDMDALGIDILCFTGHKGMLGPQGTGCLLLGPGVELRPFKRGGSGIHSYDRHQPMTYPTRLEAGTLNGHGIAGLSAAVDFLNSVGLETIAAHEAALTRRFYEAVRSIPGVTVYGDFEQPHGAIVSLNIRDYDSGAVADALSETYGIATRAGAHCAPRMHRALGTEDQGAVRFSFSWYTTAEEIDAAAQAVRQLAE